MLSRLPITVATLIKKTKYPKGFWSYLLELERAMTSSSYLFDAAMIV